MNQFKYRLFLYTICLLGSYCGTAMSHELSGDLGDAFEATDVYLVQCTTDSGGVSDYLEVSILDITKTNGGGKVNAVVQAAGTTGQTGDPIRDDGVYSPGFELHAGNGTYEVMVHKLKDGVKIYSLQYHCKSSNGAHTGTSYIRSQNQ